MLSPNFALFDTPVGPCGVVWGASGLVGVLLPEASAGATRARAKRRFGVVQETDAPPEIRQVMARIVALLSGEPDNLQDIALDTSAVPAFNLRVYELARGILPGQTLTYGEVAARLGEPQAARAVGQALGANPFPIIVPCHRVLAAGGKSGGFSAPGGARTKLRLLEIEGAPLGAGPGLFDRV
ncbi:MAG: methylated-DNA--[protein]-cysteine S-methyltransferase [Burkholderiaceae bacterium]